MKTLGICLGASTVSLVSLEAPEPSSWAQCSGRPRIVAHSLHPHEGNPRKKILTALQELDITAFDRIVATGRRFREFVRLTSISEPEAVEYAYRFVKPPEVSCPAIVSAGGESFLIYILDRAGRISNVLTGNKCASGTGEFFLQQLRRMNVSLEEAARFAGVESPHPVSGRCSVFCKSDCTHATNKGVPKSRVTAGLCRMMANKILGLLKKVARRNIMVTGGTARNRMMIEFLRKEIPGLIVPEEAPYFEALGSALWALEHQTAPFPGFSDLLETRKASFDTLPPLRDFEDRVEFKNSKKGNIRPGDVCILGLDVGSTTTKAVLLRKTDDAMLASVYLRTNGDPVGASRQCYAEIFRQIPETIDPGEISIIGLGVCGSGRQIAGLHALTDGVINEIIAHAAAAVHFDAGVDTIFEIGGQDAKYTYITNGVASDYAMNEACSAGTGSFLEESALETLGVSMGDIAPIALKGNIPPNFNDQCAAFIASDIKNVIHDGVPHQDIVAGLVYSICMNYNNRVKGSRPVGEKIFMQGGVCYNRAVPLAMAALIGKPVVVPPEPGLMGAFGAALEIKKRIEAGLMKPSPFDLAILAERKVQYGKSFFCRGGKEECDRRCEIALIELEGKKYPFGGACNRYYNLRQNKRFDMETLDLVRVRQHLVMEKYGNTRFPDKRCRGKIGFNRSFMVNTFFPLYATFFSELGFKPVLADHPSGEGIDRRNAAFCYPGELAHGFFHSLLCGENPPDFIFLPHLRAIPSQNQTRYSQVCPFVQGESYFLKATFRRELERLGKGGTRVLSPLLDLTEGLEAAREPLVDTAVQMGANPREALEAFEEAMSRQRECMAEMKAIGKKALEELVQNPGEHAVVLFARPYNGMVEEAHMGIPHKFASRGIRVIPFDFLPLEEEPCKRHMYWGMGQLILKAAELTAKHPQLFGTFITNFSCGPDSFIIGYFREIMGRKPSLTLELDSHTADAGLETRIEAFLDIVSAYRQLFSRKMIRPSNTSFVPARVAFEADLPVVVSSSGEMVPMNDPRVTLLFPSMGRLATEAMVSVFQGKGYHAKAHPQADESILKLGRGNTSCKECLPLILTTGTLLHYIRHEKRPDELLVYFMPTASGPCRFGQYSIFMEDLMKKGEIPDVAMFSLTGDNAYKGMGTDFRKKAWWSIVISDLMEDIRAMILANATAPIRGMGVFEAEWEEILVALKAGDFPRLEKQLEHTARHLGGLPMKRLPKEVPVIALVGEIFVRRDAISRQYLTERLAEKGYAVRCAPLGEWLHYSDYLVEKGHCYNRLSTMDKFKFYLAQKFMARYENRIKKILSGSGLLPGDSAHIRSVIEHAAPYVSEDLYGEVCLTVGSSLSEIVTRACGVITIGPFGCMPNRISESILSEVMNREGKLASAPNDRRLRKTLEGIEDLPFLAVESDGSPFPQLIRAKLEAFCLQAERLHEQMIPTRFLPR